MSDSPPAHEPGEDAALEAKSTGPGFVDRLAYFAFRSTEFALSLLPMGAVATLGSLGGRLFLFFSPTYRKLAARNLRIAFGGEMDTAAHSRLLWQHAAQLGQNLLCSLRMPTMSAEEMSRRIEVVGLEHVLEANRGGRGVVFVLAHVGPWELFIHTRAYLPPNRPAGAIYQALSNPLLDEHVRRTRVRNGHHLFSRKEGFQQAIALLREGGLVGVLTDQHAGDAGIFSPFFGRLASTTTLPLLLARKTKSALVAAGIETTKPGHWRITLEPLLPPESGPIENGLPVMNRAVELMLRRSPADGFWVHNRWKTPEPAFLIQGHKRGWQLPPAGQSLQPFRLIVRSPNWLGDACMAVPAVRALKRGRPDLELTILCPGKLAEFWKALPEVDGIVTREGKERVFAVAKKTRAAGPFDAGVLLPNSPRVAMEMAFGGVDRVIGYAKSWRKLFLDQVIPPKEHIGPPRHHVEYYLQIAHRVGADCSQRDLFDPIPRPAGQPPASVTPIRIGLCAGAEYGPAKRWPLEKFAAMAKAVLETRGDAIEWNLFGAPGEKELGAELEKQLEGRCRNLVGKTSLAGLIDELRGCQLLVSNDTGTMHLAALLGVPVIAIFGSTEPAWTRPMGKQHLILREHVECSPCFLRTCPLDLRCMHAITPERVAAAVLERLG
ncbi:MAG: lipopolysaccharide heptosyltransferase II [Verrucomicrobiales bacterium]